jgi:hypothetical protein
MGNNETEIQNGRYFRLSNFYLAAFLFAKGMELANVDKITDPKRAQFVFVDEPIREALVGSFNFGKEDDEEVLVDARKLVAAIKTLKDKLYQGDF